ncbi:chemotaxis protein CheW [Herbivorax sp. ANBcel31]|uniref:chemotaxis protein CheW n=1 Tax=Herbivorax sp. ANBcel31 TaxID=3069754 RepID=UPI0027B7A74A|nr:chemotaxis protein CheW [Herbivorax sp. ANBcel31]MDQ2086630.1 chemotaxis protein CheW [Herbivorax sp. ANBcel31]
MSEVLENILDYEEDTQKGKHLTFAISSEIYGIEIKYVTEIIGIQKITEVPEMPDYVKGIINLRGKIIPVIDVRLRFKKDPLEYNDRTCIVVVEIKNISLGLIVDSVSEVVAIPESDIVPPPDSSTGFKNKYIKGIGKIEDEVKLLIDCEKLVNDEDCEKLVNAS